MGGEGVEEKRVVSQFAVYGNMLQNGIAQLVTPNCRPFVFAWGRAVSSPDTAVTLMNTSCWNIFYLFI